ncbi:MAG: hypothetical protein JNJ60_23380, partial [Rhodocyclaceae bacterium]|nr:hypothetical protein [Rhodocyclaceae bacterium]
VPARDAASLRAAVHFLATNPAARERLGAAARLRYMRDFTRRAFAERLCEILAGSGTAGARA